RFETSFWGRLANRLFLLFGDGTSGVLLDADESGFVLVFQDAEREVRVAAPRAAVSRVLRRMPSLPWTSGFAVEEGAAAAALSLELLADGALALRPVVVTVGEARVYERPSVAPFLLDQHVLLPGARTLLGLLAARRPFAEPETGDQALLDFGGEGYRPSPIGLPLDRETLVPREKVPRFLARHRAEIDALPEVLVPEELRGGGLLRVSGARLHLVSDSRSHLVVELFLLMKEREVPLGTVLTARRAKEKLLSFGGRLLDLTDPALDFVDLLGKGAIEGAGDAVRLRLTPLELCLVRAYLRGPVSITSESGVSPAALERLESSSPSAPPPPSLGVSLFPFQEAGLSWLWFLRQNGFGGLLCDDMGLGKTHQAMALIAAMTRDGGEAPSVLVVCPASVIPHWEEKLSKVLPGIPLVTHHGASRRELKPRPGVTLTTWGTLRSDVAGESPLAPFDLAVFDEIQQAKSPASQVHRAARHVAAGMKLGLTGTPIENTTADLVALLGLVVPGLLPEAPAARRAFESDEGRDLESRGRLSRLVKPFVLRRTKAQVLDGLPPKILDTRHCELSPEQKALYQDTLKGAQGLRDALGTSDRVSYLHVFAVLSRLKRICDHPALVGGSEDAGSGKWDLFTELLEESLASSLKVVVFTQYLGMLKLFARHLSGKGVGFAEIKGDTKDRAEPVTRFREDPKCRVFLASLKAGGVGIDLTPASVVIHYDRWWNAAREEQATDRVHRLGQKRGVHVLRLVTKGTLEERIDWLIEQKAALLGEVVPEDDPSLVKQFERSELVDLLSGPAFG
ncbi:MAG: DEAD/DEAH box helicase, partial [Acidobacteria bacterium]|nr:DEAD/DEAH box helicase [Acidobacteriota bacterium]